MIKSLKRAVTILKPSTSDWRLLGRMIRAEDLGMHRIVRGVGHADNGEPTLPGPNGPMVSNGVNSKLGHFESGIPHCIKVLVDHFMLGSMDSQFMGFKL